MKAPAHMSAAIRERMKYVDSCGAKLKRNKRALAKGVCIRNMRRRLKREIQADMAERKRRTLSLESMEQGSEWEALQQYEEEQRAREKQQNTMEAPKDYSSLPEVDLNVFVPALLTRSSSFRDKNTSRISIQNVSVKLEPIRQYEEEQPAQKKRIPTASKQFISTIATESDALIPDFLTRSHGSNPTEQLNVRVQGSELEAMRQYEEEQRAREKQLHTAEEHEDKDEQRWITREDEMDVHEVELISPAFLTRSFSFRDTDTNQS